MYGTSVRTSLGLRRASDGSCGEIYSTSCCRATLAGLDRGGFTDTAEIGEVSIVAVGDELLHGLSGLGVDRVQTADTLEHASEKFELGELPSCQGSRRRCRHK